jgi:hypothetical protein
LFGERTLCSYAKERPEKAGRAKAKEPSMHRIGCGNNLEIFAVQDKSKTRSKYAKANLKILNYRYNLPA